MSTAPEPTGTPDIRPRRLPSAGVRAGTLADTVWRSWSNAQPFVVPARSEWPLGLRRVRIAGLTLLGIQLVALCWWSQILANRFALTSDFSTYEQAVYLITHGHLDPYITTLGHVFWKDHSAFIIWPLSLLEFVWPHPVTLLWLQDAAAAGLEIVAFSWICDLAAHHARRSEAATEAIGLAILGIILLVPDPWMLWASSFDFHIEAISAFFAVAAARELFLGRRRAWLWGALTLASGDLGATYLMAVGGSAVLSGRWRWRQGALTVLAAVVWFIFLGAIHGTQGSPAHAYGLLITGNSAGLVPRSDTSLSVLSSAVAHPARALSALWDNRVDLWANIGPGGVIGLLWLPVLVPLALILGEGQLTSIVDFSYPGFQSIAVVPLVAVGTIALCAALLRPGRRRRARRWVVTAGGTVLAANAILWSVSWVPHVQARWLTVSKGAAAFLDHIESKIRPADEVIASQGIRGRFADRSWTYSDLLEPVHAKKIWVILAPAQGIELGSVAKSYGAIARVSRIPGARLFGHASGIWAFEVDVRPGTRELDLNPPSDSVTPGWAVAGPAGTSVLEGPVSDWHTAGTGKPGYVTDHSYWREPAGTYQAAVTLAVSSTANLEVWNATTGQLLSRQTLMSTNGKATITVVVHLQTAPAEPLYSGWGIWRQEVVEPVGDQLEVRVWSPGVDDEVDVYRVSLKRRR